MRVSFQNTKESPQQNILEPGAVNRWERDNVLKKKTIEITPLWVQF